MMRRVRIALLRARAVFRRDSLEREMEAEMANHIESEVESLVARGMSLEEARARAAGAMGRLDLIHEKCRDARGVMWWDDLRQDAAFALRLLLRNKTYSTMALATMALGIGSTSSVFSVVDTVLLRPLPYAEPERLISVDGIGMRGPFDTMRAGSRVADYAAHQGMRFFNLEPGERAIPERIKGSEVSANFFAVLGIAPLMGRTFHSGEDGPGLMRVAVLSYSFWMHRYGGHTDAVGRQLVLDETPYVIAGVMPAGFRFPSPDVQIWTPMTLDPRSAGDYWGMGGTHMFARLRPGETVETARAELYTQVPRIRAMFPWRMPDAWGAELDVRDLKDALVAGARMRTWMLLGAVALVLLIAVVNVANLMIGSTTARAREIALRASLGATPARLGRQLLTEALVLTLAGGIAGVGLAYLQTAALRSLLPAGTPRLSEVAIDWRVLAFAAAVSILSALLVSVWPAWRVRSCKTLTGPGDVRPMRAGTVLVMTEAALATVLLVGSGLMLRSVWTMLQVDPGFEVESIVTAELSPSRSASRRAALWEEVRAQLLRYPGVREVGAMNVLPLTPQVSAFAAAIEDHPLPPQEPQYVLWSTSVTPEHTVVLGVKLLAGRRFTRSDHARSEPVVIISKSTARRFWPDRNPIGRRLKPVSDREWRTIVGVVDDVRTFGIAGPPDWINGEVYLPLAQSFWSATPASLVIRLEGDSTPLEKSLPNLVYEVCPSCAVSKIAPMKDVVSRAVEAPRSSAWLIAGFTVLALVLAAAGIYGVVSHAVLRRTRELGVRLALGAGRGRVAALVVRASLVSVAAGCVVGLAAAWALVRLIRTLLFGIAPHDAVSFGTAPVLLLTMALLASALPAIRATRIDPAQCLREG